jgi:hypothetical protein
LKNSQKQAGDDLSNATNPADAAAIVSSEFERPSDKYGEMRRRAMMAAQYSNIVGAKATAPTPPPQPSQTTVETNINTINVQTQATDANGVAKDMGKALQDNALISAGIMGAI